jgi:hypothetical protein
MSGFVWGVVVKVHRVVILSALVVAACPTTSSAESSVLRFKTNGYAFGVFGDCPDVPEDPAPGTVCHEAFVQLFNESVAFEGGGLAPPKTPWAMLVYESTLTFVAVDESPVETDVRWGFLPFVDPAAVTYDREHLAFASIDTEVDMADGTTIAIALVWRAISDRFVYGNDGPALDDFGLIRHHVDECSTQVNQGHQKFRIAAVSGTFDGDTVHSYTAFPSGYISFNHFVSIDVDHGKTCA